MKTKVDLEKKIIKLKLDKRELVLAGKDTSKIDEEILCVKKLLDDLENIVIINK